MGIIDRLRPTPRWKHADPQVRFEGVRDLGPDEQALLAELASSDSDARVRRAAVTRLDDPSRLGEVLGRDTDESVREEARSRLQSIAVEGGVEDRVLAAVAALREVGEHRSLATIAKSAQLEAAGLAALESLHESKTLSAVARQAVHEKVALAAVRRLADAVELAQVALKSEHRDVALAALEHVSDPDRLQAIAARAKHKIVARRAKAILRVPDEPEQPVGPSEYHPIAERLDEAGETHVEPLSNDVRRSQVELCERLEALVHGGAMSGYAPGLDEAARRWLDLAAVQSPETDLADRFHGALTALRSHIPAPADELPAQTAFEAEPAPWTVPAEAMLQEVAGSESASGASIEATSPIEMTAPAELAAPTEKPALTTTESTPFAEPVAAEPAPAPPPLTPEEIAERRIRLGQVLTGAEQLLQVHDLPDVRARWSALRREWTSLAAGLELDEAEAARIKAIEASLDSRESELREQRAHQQRENLARLQHLCERLEQLAQGEHLALRDAEQGLRDARAALDAPGPLPSRQDQQQIVGRLKSVQAALFPRVQDLREADEWERWANAGVQESIIRRLEALREEPDLGVVARQLRNAQDEWHKVRAVPREKGRELWQRYKAIESEIRSRCETYFEQQASARGENLVKKEELCTQVEALADSTDWIRTAETIKGLQAQWKTIGPVTPGHEKAVWERFRQACDRFFTRRKDDLTQRKSAWTANLQKKETICAQIEALGDSTDWDKALSEVKRLQAEWRTVGPVKRTRAEAILLRFRTSCEHFFERYTHRNEMEFAEHAAARERICQELETLLPAPDQPEGALAAPEGLTKKVQALKRQWDQAPSLPQAQAEPLAARFGAALTQLGTHFPDVFRGTDLDPDANRKKLEQMCAQVESYVTSDDPALANASPAEILAMQWREALAANTIGGRVDDEAKWRNAAEEIRKAQAAWRRVGPVPDAVARELNDRFQRACNRFFKQRDQRRKSPPPPR